MIAAVRFRAKVNYRRLAHMRQHAIAVLRRAPRNERPALLSRFAAKMTKVCIRLEVVE